MLQKFAVLMLCCLVGACGTMHTVPEKGQNKLRYSSTFNDYPCKTIPRVYSGVILDGCWLLGPPNPNVNTVLMTLYFGDVFLSLVADTVVLPYTVYGQVRYGNIPISQTAAAQ